MIKEKKQWGMNGVMSGTEFYNNLLVEFHSNLHRMLTASFHEYLHKLIFAIWDVVQ